MEQPRESKSSSETENKESKVKVGQQSFNNYLKVQADELEAQGVHVKRDNEFKRSIASKWKTLTPNEKAKYCVPNANDSSKLTKKRKEQAESPATISTRCSPQMFQQVVSKFSEEQNAAITELGFGTLLQLSCTQVRIALKLVKHPDNQARVAIDKATEDQEKEDQITNLGKKRKRKQEDISPVDNDTVLHTKQVHAHPQEHDKTQAHAKRGRGRPRGSTNKKKLMRNTD